MNGTIIFELLGEVEKNVELLEELRGLSRADFVNQPRNYLYAERCFQIAIQWPHNANGANLIQLPRRFN